MRKNTLKSLFIFNSLLLLFCFCFLYLIVESMRSAEIRSFSELDMAETFLVDFVKDIKALKESYPQDELSKLMNIRTQIAIRHSKISAYYLVSINEKDWITPNTPIAAVEISEPQDCFLVCFPNLKVKIYQESPSNIVNKIHLPYGMVEKR